MKFLTRYKLRFLARLGGVTVPLGGLISNIQAGAPSLESTLGGMLDGALIGLSLGAYHAFVYDGGRVDFFRRMTFIQSLAVNSLAYALCIIAMRTIGHLLRGIYSHPLQAFQDPLLFETVLIALALSLATNLTVKVSELIGPGELRRFVVGRYHQPHSETRIFLLVDLVGSTTIAEQSGPLRFLSLLDTLYRDMTEPILRTGAEVYKYVGDEIILTWPAERASAECLRFMHYLDEVLAARRPHYLERFGLVPGFRAALHGGEVVSGEIGLLKKEIAYLGDVLNTAARMLEVCRSSARSFLCSEEVVALLGPIADIGFRRIGSQPLRGRAEPVALLEPIVEATAGLKQD